MTQVQINGLTGKVNIIKHSENPNFVLSPIMATSCNLQTTISKCADEVNLVFPCCERIPLSVDTSDVFFR